MKQDEIVYEIQYSRRKSLAMKFSREGVLIVKVPMGIQKQYILDFLHKKEKWIYRQYTMLQKRGNSHFEIKKGETISFRGKSIQVEDPVKTKKWLIEEARKEIHKKAMYFSEQIGVTYNRIAIREQRTRWGSCSTKSNLNFNWKLILMPEEILNYVIIHELIHLIEMNHSSRFWNLVGYYCPKYKEYKAWLKTHGADYE